MSKRCAECGGPRFGLSDYCAACRHPGMARTPDHATSEAAAKNVTRRLSTIRQRVIAYAESAPQGFIDMDLLDKFGGAESSYRKRRTELTEEGVIVATSSTRTNRNGQQATVFVYRGFHPNPPPEVVKAKGKAADAIRRSKREKAMFNTLVELAWHHAGGTERYEKIIAEALDLDYPIVRANIPAPLPL